MPRAPRFPFKLQTWVPEEHANAIASIADEQLLDVSDVLRQAVMMYLRTFNAMPPRVARPNGVHQAAE
jgi:hypothetical protein